MAGINPTPTQTPKTGILTTTIEAVLGIKHEPKPDLNPVAILYDLKKDPTIMMVRDNKISIRKDSVGQAYDEPNITGEQKEKAVRIIQRGLIALGLIKVDQKKNNWWNSFQWGGYGDITAGALEQIQEAGGISKKEIGGGGYMVGPETLKLLEIAMQARVQNKDWKTAIEKHLVSIK